MKNVKLEFNLPVSIIKEGKSYVAYTPALGLSTSAENYEQAKRRFSEVVNIFFEEIIKKETAENVLRDLGWKKVQAKWNPPIVVSQESQNIKVLAK